MGNLRQKSMLRLSQACPWGEGTQPQKEGDLWNTVRKGLQSQS